MSDIRVSTPIEMKRRRAALVTGGSKRIGREISLKLASLGYDIALHFHQSEMEAKELQNMIQNDYHVECQIFQCDLSQSETLESWFHSIFKQMPHLEVLVNNASVFKRCRFNESDLELYHNQIAVNATAPIFLSKAFAKHVTQGHIINMLDADIHKNHGSHFVYLLSKKLLKDFTLMAARELGPMIQVNAICPGVVLPSTENPIDYEAHLLERLPIKTLPNTTDITESIAWLLKQKHITGQMIFNDSGQHLL